MDTLSIEPPPVPQTTTRLAPSPTGSLHLGNARTFLINWALARSQGWNICMRMEDLDGPRIKPESAQETLDLLQWLGLDWDGDVMTQSDDVSPYREAMQQLCRQGQAFSCSLSRSEIDAAASAPQEDAQAPHYPPHLRPDGAGTPIQFLEDDDNYRFLVSEDTIRIDDQISEPTSFTLSESAGDFVVWTRRGTPAYQLSVVVDDIRQGVTDVIRGDDLLESAARQTLIYNALGHDPPRWWHLPLVRGTDGRRLAKRHGDTRLSTYRTRGVPPERIIGLLAAWCGFVEEPEEMSMNHFLDVFELDRIPANAITLQPEEETWLAST